MIGSDVNNLLLIKELGACVWSKLFSGNLLNVYYMCRYQILVLWVNIHKKSVESTNRYRNICDIFKKGPAPQNNFDQTLTFTTACHSTILHRNSMEVGI